MSNNTDASGVIAGFVYQIFYFLYRLLKIQDGETVSLEKIDDVGAEGGGMQTYYQLKHSINSKPSAVKRMVDRDNDLWKTLNMWVNKVKEKGDDESQRQWIEESEFVLISNKTAENNRLYELIKAYKTEESKWSELEQYLSEQAAKKPKEGDARKDGAKNIYSYTKNVNEYALNKELLRHVTIEFESDEELEAKVNSELQYGKFIPEKRVNDMRLMLKGLLMEKILKQEAEYTKESFAGEFGPLFNDMRIRKFIPLNREVVLPEQPMEQTFVKQLQGVDAPRSHVLQEVIRMTEQKLAFENDYNAANKMSGIHDQRQFEQDLHTEWRNIFDDYNGDLTSMSDEEDKSQAGKMVLKEVKKVKLKYGQEDIGPTESNGCFYHFSDGKEPQIGWRCDWESLYDGKEWTTD